MIEKPLDQPFETTLTTSNRTLVGSVLFFLAVIFCFFNGILLLFYQSQSPYFQDVMLIITGILYLPFVLLSSYLVYKCSALLLILLEGLGWLLHLKRFKTWMNQLYTKYTFLMAFLGIQIFITFGFIYQLLMG